MQKPCVVVLGGSFDPVHNGHVALADYFLDLLAPAVLRVVPAGNPWQKNGLNAKPEDRVAMIERAFGPQKLGLTIDQQEIHRHTATYSIDTLRALRAQLGADTSIAFLIGADQLQKLHTWRDWQKLFDYAHLCAASRPGFMLDGTTIDPAVAAEFAKRKGRPEQIRSTPYGFTTIGTGLSVDISATEVRDAIANGAQPASLLPPGVLDYIQQHHLYQS